MKKMLLSFAALIVLFNVAYGQSSSIIVDGGWVTIAPEDRDNSLEGSKVGGQYEYVMGYNSWAIGLAVHSLGFKNADPTGVFHTKYHTWPVNFYGKYLIGEDKLQGYVKGVAGMQFYTSRTEAPSGDVVKKNDFGFTVGTGAGINYKLGDDIFINADYELLYLRNVFNGNALTNAITLGVGLKL